jgi:hypothetical protein
LKGFAACRDVRDDLKDTYHSENWNEGEVTAIPFLAVELGGGRHQSFTRAYRQRDGHRRYHPQNEADEALLVRNSKQTKTIG